MYYFCTYFDQQYLNRGLALYKSLRDHCPDFTLWALCMDDTAYRILEELETPGFKPIALEEFEKNDDQLKEAKTNRSRIEYYFTCTPSLPLFILNNWPEVDLITYLDADLFFFDNPSPIFQEMDEASIAIIGHRFPPNLKHLELYGIYNVGWISFRRDHNGIDCLNWWRDRCLEWCYDRYEDGRFADQKYLDDWSTRFQGVRVIEHKGANVAPWNVSNYKLSMVDGRVMIDDQSLLFFHFHGTKQVISSLYTTSLRAYTAKSSSLLRKKVFKPYIKALLKAELTFTNSLNQNITNGIRELNDNQVDNRIKRLKKIKKLFLDVLFRDFVIVRG